MTITPIYAGLLAIVYFLLSWRIISMRGPGGPSFGDGGDPVLLRRIRAHGNFAEYVPFLLIFLISSTFFAMSDILRYVVLYSAIISTRRTNCQSS